MGKTKAFTSLIFVLRVIPLYFRFSLVPFIAYLLIANLLRNSFSQNPSLVIRDPSKIKCDTTSICFPSTTIYPWSSVITTLVLPTFRYRPAFSLANFTLSIIAIRSYLVLAINVVSSAYRRLVILLPPILITPSQSSNTSSLCFLHIC